MLTSRLQSYKAVVSQICIILFLLQCASLFSKQMQQSVSYQSKWEIAVPRSGVTTTTGMLENANHSFTEAVVAMKTISGP